MFHYIWLAELYLLLGLQTSQNTIPVHACLPNQLTVFEQLDVELKKEKASHLGAPRNTFIRLVENSQHHPAETM